MTPIDGPDTTSPGSPAGNESTSGAWPRIREAIFETMPVDVEAYVGSATLTVSELSRCQPGQILTLNRTLADLVELRVNGVTVATGELVSVQDQFAIRIGKVLS